MIEQFDTGSSPNPQTSTLCNGENAWKRELLPDLMVDLAGEGKAVVSGEVWVVEGNLFSALSPRKDGGWAVFSWEVSPRWPGEQWEHFVTRSMRETLDAIRGLNAESEVAEEVRDRIYYHVSCCDEAAYEKGRSEPVRLDQPAPPLEIAV